MADNFKSFLLSKTRSDHCKELEVIQSLWSGYGKISRYQLSGSKEFTVIVKCISLNQLDSHPRGWNTDVSHQKKVRSYQVETAWYEQYSTLCKAECTIPNFIGFFSEGKNQWIIMEDLDTRFPLRKSNLSIPEVKACLSWLAHFHGTFMNDEPKGLWEIGTYWHLDTRPDEFQKMAPSELKNQASAIDKKLNNARFKTFVHGDAKLANFCFSESGNEVAAVDFQYVGGGCGMKDVAYFLGSCLSSEELESHSPQLLEFYFSELEKSICQRHAQGNLKEIEFSELETEWRELYPYAWADFTRFLLGWMHGHQKINGYSLRMIEEVLSDLA